MMQQLNYLWFDMQPMLGLSEDMVQQRADPRLGGKYPPKAAARVKLLTNIIFFLSKPFLVYSLGFTSHSAMSLFFLSHKRYCTIFVCL